jgi:arabinose-5-phosphate isomerase
MTYPFKNSSQQKYITYMLDELKDILVKEANAISNIPITNDYEKAINLIVKKIHSDGGKLICSGMGKAGQIALNISTTFSSTGTPSVYLHPSEAQHGDLGILQKNDIMLLISNSGKTREIIELISLSKNLYKDIPVICITRNKESLLSKQSDVTLLTGKTKEICPMGLTPTVSTTVMSVIGDCLVYGTMKRIGFTSDEYSKRHHSGYLGKKSKASISNNNI